MISPVKLRTGLSVMALLAAALAIGASPLSGQARPGPQIPAPPQESDSETAAKPETSPSGGIAVESALVYVDVLVTDEDGKVLGGLKQSNFRVFDDGELRAVTNFAAADEPITIVLLLEYSGLSYDYFAYKGAAWGSRFLDELTPQDWVALVTYDLRSRVAVDFTHSKPQINDALQMMSYPAFREANMFDAVADTLDQLDHVKGKKSILLIGTGADTFSSHTLQETYGRLKESDVTVFCIGTAEQEYAGADTSISYVQAKNALHTFAKLTGGLAWFPRFEGELQDIFASVSGFLRNQYRVGFSPVALPHDGKYRKIRIEVVGEDGKPLVVTNEKGKRRKVTVFAREGYVDTKISAGK